MNKRDIFDKELKRRLKDFEVAPRADLWSSIESTLDKVAASQSITAQPTPQPKSNRRLLISAITSVAAAIILSVILYNREDDNILLPSNFEHLISSIEPKELEFDMLSNVIAQAAPLSDVVEAKRPDIIKSLDKPIATTAKPESKSESVDIVTNESKEAKGDKIESNRYIHTASVANDKEQQDRVDAIIAKYSNKKDGGIKINVGGGMTSLSTLTSNKGYSTFGVPLPQVRFATLGNTADEGLAKSTPAIYTDTNQDRYWRYQAPISFSLTGVKMLNSWLGIETGITYTSLKAISLGGEPLRADIESSYDYIGVPLNLYAEIFDISMFTLYSKVGALVDKCVDGRTVSTIDRVSETEKMKVEGVQLSLQLQAGVNIRLFDFMNLYIEPSLMYYVEGNQPKSYRTDNRFGFTTSAGIRFIL